MKVLRHQLFITRVLSLSVLLSHYHILIFYENDNNVIFLFVMHTYNILTLYFSYGKSTPLFYYDSKFVPNILFILTLRNLSLSFSLVSPEGITNKRNCTLRSSHMMITRNNLWFLDSGALEACEKCGTAMLLEDGSTRTKCAKQWLYMVQQPVQYQTSCRLADTLTSIRTIANASIMGYHFFSLIFE